jgi:hypothetical protein
MVSLAGQVLRWEDMTNREDIRAIAIRFEASPCSTSWPSTPPWEAQSMSREPDDPLAHRAFLAIDRLKPRRIGDFS